MSAFVKAHTKVRPGSGWLARVNDREMDRPLNNNRTNTPVVEPEDSQPPPKRRDRFDVV
jgi:hypothetical protein